ncbi:MAG: hypothetical protein MJ107_02910 [Lachnospiraceae bacterium]|nr:hypothetical protein [Lachnospiraceae bacterium]
MSLVALTDTVTVPTFVIVGTVSVHVAPLSVESTTVVPSVTEGVAASPCALASSVPS